MSKSDQSESLFFSDPVPVLQNRVYRDRGSARNATAGSLNIVLDRKTGMFVNDNFSEDLMQYDPEYDNSVPSDTFMRYYDSIAGYLVNRYDLSTGVVLDIGCGKGTFISRLASTHEFVLGFGIDPAYDGPESMLDGRVSFISEYFEEKHLSRSVKPAIVICRHTLEHIPSPISFLESITEPFRSLQYADVPVFIEVPDLAWILDQYAFWDFCYEHVNYFTKASLSNCITEAGGRVVEVQPAFDGQYIWAEALLNPSNKNLIQREQRRLDPIEGVPEVNEKRLMAHLDTVTDRIREIAIERKIVIWGMATKGVMYALHLAKAGVPVDYCIDINQRKQGKYSPVTGYEISPPDSMSTSYKYAIICMNPNYTKEIQADCERCSLDAILYSPDGREIAPGPV